MAHRFLCPTKNRATVSSLIKAKALLWKVQMHLIGAPTSTVTLKPQALILHKTGSSALTTKPQLWCVLLAHTNHSFEILTCFSGRNAILHQCPLIRCFRSWSHVMSGTPFRCLCMSPRSCKEPSEPSCCRHCDICIMLLESTRFVKKCQRKSDGLARRFIFTIMSSACLQHVFSMSSACLQP